MCVCDHRTSGNEKIDTCTCISSVSYLNLEISLLSAYEFLESVVILVI